MAKSVQRVVRLKKIDGIRALAVGAVVGYHTLPDLFPVGFYGVDAFFVLSGYLITRQMIGLGDEISKIYIFFERRVRRIIPALIPVWVFLVFIASRYMMPRELEEFSKQFATHILFFSNFFFLEETLYFFDLSKSILLHTWSLSIEEQFYVLFPFLFVFCRTPRRSAATFFSITVVSFAYCTSTYFQSGSDLTYFNSAARFWELSLGVFCASLRKDLIVPQRMFALVDGFGVIALALLLQVSTEPEWTPFHAVMVAAATLLVMMARPDSKAVANSGILNIGALGWIGRRSYGIYLWHYPLIWYWTTAWGLSGMSMVAAVLSSTVVLAALSFDLLEMPVRDRRFIRSTPVLFGSFLGITSLALFIAFAAHFSSDADWRMPSGLDQIVRAKSDFDPNLQDCMITSGSDFRSELVKRAQEGEFCAVTAGPQTPIDFVVWGDSHAWSLSESFRMAGEATDTAGLLAAYPNCPPLSGTVNPPDGRQFRCPEYFRAVRNHLEREGIKTIFLVARWSFYTRGPFQARKSSEFGGTLRSVNTPEEEDTGVILRHALMKTLEELKEYQVIIVLDIPMHVRSVPDGMYVDRVRRRTSDWATTKTAYLGYTSPANEIILEVVSTFPKVEILEPADALCRSGVCQISAEGTPIYIDDNHLNRRGGQMLAPMLEAALWRNVRRSQFPPSGD